MNDPITEISPDEFATDFDRFVHIDEVTAIAAERDAAVADRDIADATIGDIATALGEPDIDPDEIAPRVERLLSFAHRIQRAFATPGCENEPLKIPYLGLLAERVAGLTNRLDEAHAVIRNIATALGDPEQDHDDLPDSVEALRLQRDRLQAAAKGALGEVLRG